MEDAQDKTYGDWILKIAISICGPEAALLLCRLVFLQLPYAFGMLFGVGLYAIYQRRGDDFIPDYKKLLASTGEAPAAELAARFDIDIRDKKFWEDSLAGCR